MTGRWKNKPKKVVETTLGKAPKDLENGPDVSHLRQPIATSIRGIKDIMTLFQRATSEVQDYITYECDILYECRVCRNIFRSLANFILHKRQYCKGKWQFGGGKDDIQGGFVLSDDIKTSDEESRCATPVEKTDPDLSKADPKKGILPIIDKLLKKQNMQVLAKKTLNEDLSQKGENSDDDVIFVSEENSVALQKIEGSGAAVFQTSVNGNGSLDAEEGLMKSEILEIHGILDRQAVLDRDGKICNFSTNKLWNPNIPKQNLTCTECNFTFSTMKTLTHHIKYKHNKSCIVFLCPDCKETFSNAWSVYRHLYKVHRRTTSQVRRMRHLVHTSQIRKDQEPEKKKRKANVETENEENQWLNNFEGDKDLQMCGGCGKRFERKAALHSHSQMCTKRIAVCNSIKNVKLAKNEKKEKLEEVEVKVKGAAKRKQSASVVLHIVTEPKPESETKEESCESESLPSSLEPDVTITKHYEAGSEPDPLAVVPDVEIFTISDDDEESNDKKRKRADSDPPPPEVPEELKEHFNDEEDQCFLTKMTPYVDMDDLKCTPCGTTYMSIYMLLGHMSLHFSWFRFQCSKCSFMSFHKYDCTAHAYTSHCTPNNLIESTVMPIPKWKVLSAAHEFKELDEDEDEEEEDTSREENENMPRLEAVTVMDLKIQTVQENGVEVEDTIVLEDDEMPDICTENGISLLGDEKKDIASIEKKEKAGPSSLGVSSRPVRNRVQSVKTLQNDFIYDLGKAVKINDNASKNKKVKKSLCKP